MTRIAPLILALEFVASGARSATNQGLIDQAAKYCENVPEDLGLRIDSDALLSQVVGPENYLDSLAFDADCTTVQACIDKYRSDLIPQGVRLVIPILLAIISLIIWLFLSCCACCRCCRQSCIWCCCKEKRAPSYFSRGLLAFIWSSFALFFILAIVDSGFAGLSADHLRRGSESILCRSLTLASDVLNGGNMTEAIGGTNISFIGAEPLYQELDSLAGVLEPGSETMLRIETTVNNTVALVNTMNRLLSYLDLTDDMLGDLSNLQPTPGSKYECVVCRACCANGSDSYVSQMRSAISRSYAESIKEVRKQILSTLVGPGLTESRDAVTNAAETMGNITKTIEEDFGQPVLDNVDTIDLSLLLLWVITIVLACSALVPVFWIIIAIIYGVVKSYKLSYTDPDDKPRNPCVASTGWCLSILYGFLIFLLAGILLLIGYAQSSFCLAFGDLDTTVDKAVARYDDVFGGEDNIAESVLTSCLKSSGDGDFLSSVTSGNLTAREVFNNVTRISDLINTAFNESPEIPSVANVTEFKLLVDSMFEYKGLSMIPPDRIVALRTDPAFNVNGPMDAEQTRTGYGSSGYCNAKTYDLTKTPVGDYIAASLTASDVTLPDDLTAITIPGASAYRSSISTITGFTYSGTCADLVLTEDAYNPFSGLLYWKGEVMKKTNFKCNTINEILDITTGEIIFEQVTGTCANPSSFDAYIVNLRNSLIDAATAVDEEALRTKERIQAEILDAITDGVIPPIQTVLDNSDCRVLRFGWNSLYNSFCTDLAVGVVGLGITFAIFGGLTLIAVLVMVIIWRNLKDNISLWRDLTRERADRRSAIRNVVTASPHPAAVQIIPNPKK